MKIAVAAVIVGVLWGAGPVKAMGHPPVVRVRDAVKRHAARHIALFAKYDVPTKAHISPCRAERGQVLCFYRLVIHDAWEDRCTFTYAGAFGAGRTIHLRVVRRGECQIEF